MFWLGRHGKKQGAAGQVIRLDLGEQGGGGRGRIEMGGATCKASTAELR